MKISFTAALVTLLLTGPLSAVAQPMGASGPAGGAPATTAARSPLPSPSAIVYTGKDGPNPVEGAFVRNAGTGVWTETNTEMKAGASFATVSESTGEVTLRDDGRQMLIRIDLKAHTVQWSNMADGVWHRLYTVIFFL